MALSTGPMVPLSGRVTIRATSRYGIPRAVVDPDGSAREPHQRQYSWTGGSITPPLRTRTIIILSTYHSTDSISSTQTMDSGPHTRHAPALIWRRQGTSTTTNRLQRPTCLAWIARISTSTTVLTAG